MFALFSTMKRSLRDKMSDKRPLCGFHGIEMKMLHCTTTDPTLWMCIIAFPRTSAGVFEGLVGKPKSLLHI